LLHVKYRRATAADTGPHCHLRAEPMPIDLFDHDGHRCLMFTDLFESAARVQALREGPAGTLLEAFAHALERDRYAAITARRHLRLLRPVEPPRELHGDAAERGILSDGTPAQEVTQQR